MAGAALSAPWRVLAFWPLALSAACTVYDDTLINGVTVSLGGGAGSSGAAGGSGAAAGKSNAAGGAEAGSAGADSAGKGGDVVAAGAGGNAGSAGTDSGGMGGGAGAAGSAGSGTGGDPMMLDLAHLDDMEDGDAAIDAIDGRNGYWFVGGDTTKGATLEPPSTKFAMTDTQGDRSNYAASVKATGFTDWGSVMGFNFVELARVVNPYDASKFCGVHFWGKAAAATAVIFRVPDGDTHPNGNVCKEGGTNNDACYDHFVQKTPFTTAWQQYSVKFSSLTQLGSGYHPADGKLKTDKLYSLEWALPNGVKTYQIWVDDVEFLTKCE